MKVDVSFKYMERSQLIDNIVDKNLERIERRLAMFAKDDPIHLSIHIEKNPHHEQYFCRSHVYLPSRVIKAESRAEKIARAINDNFSALLKQLDRLKYKIEKHLSWHRDKRRMRLGEEPEVL